MYGWMAGNRKRGLRRASRRREGRREFFGRAPERPGKPLKNNVFVEDKAWISFPFPWINFLRSLDSLPPSLDSLLIFLGFPSSGFEHYEVTAKRLKGLERAMGRSC
jgi:hypothetical protein